MPPSSPDPIDSDIVVVGAGAAGLMAAISARRASPSRRVLVLDSARKVGAKILIAGGGRCNVTHHHVDETAFAGSTRPAIRKVLGRFNVARTIAFFEEIGVTLKREDTGKLFPTTDDARTVLNALLDEARRRGVEILHPRRVVAIERAPEGFAVSIDRGERSPPRAWSSRPAARASRSPAPTASATSWCGHSVIRSRPS